MIRIIVRTDDGGFACNIGGPGTPAHTTYKTFDIEAPELEAFMRESFHPSACIMRQIVGASLP